jgi:hypothetical protein
MASRPQRTRRGLGRDMLWDTCARGGHTGDEADAKERRRAECTQAGNQRPIYVLRNLVALATDQRLHPGLSCLQNLCCRCHTYNTLRITIGQLRMLSAKTME